MDSMQCHKPVHGNAVVLHKTSSETYHSKSSHEHSLTEKVKEMAHSAGKMFEHKNHHQNNGEYCHQPEAQHGVVKTYTTGHHENHAQQSAAFHRPGATHATKTEKKEGHGGNFVSNIGEHIKNLTSKKKHRKNRAGNCDDDARSGSRSSSSSDESDHETCEKKKQ